MYKMNKEIDWHDQKTLTALGVPPVLEVANSEPATRAHRGHTRRAELDLAAAVDAHVCDHRDPLTVMLADEERAGDEYEEDERDAAATEHMKIVSAADRAAQLTPARTAARHRALWRAAVAARQGEMLAGAVAPAEPGRNPVPVEVISIRFGAWDWTVHGFWLQMHAGAGECVTTKDTRRSLVPVYYLMPQPAANAPRTRSHHARRAARRSAAGDGRQAELF